MIWHASTPARWTLIGAVAGSLLLVGLTVLWLRPGREQPELTFAEPWEPPTAAVRSDLPSPSATRPSPAGSTASSPPGTRRPTTRPPATRPPSKRPAPVEPNLSLRADGEADGSSKAQGTSFKDVRDGTLRTFWSPVGETGEISNKWPVPVTLSRIRIREAPGGGRIGDWQVRNHDTGTVLASGNGAGVITFAPVSLRKITFVILGAGGTPRVGEYETFAR